MGTMHELRTKHGLPGVTMTYEQGGAIQVFKMGEKEVRLGPQASIEEIKAAFKDEK